MTDVHFVLIEPRFVATYLIGQRRGNLADSTCRTIGVIRLAAELGLVAWMFLWITFLWQQFRTAWNLTFEVKLVFKAFSGCTYALLLTLVFGTVFIGSSWSFSDSSCKVEREGIPAVLFIVVIYMAMAASFVMTMLSLREMIGVPQHQYLYMYIVVATFLFSAIIIGHVGQGDQKAGGLLEMLFLAVIVVATVGLI